MPRVPSDEIARLKTEVSLVRLVEAAGVKLEKRGVDFVGRCPFHDDRSPSFVVSPKKNLWNCFGACGGKKGSGGDVIAFVMRKEGVSFRHAVELLRDGCFGVGVPNNQPAREMKNGPPPVRSRVQKMAPLDAENADDQALLNRVAAYYHETLKTAPEAQQYLEGRGLNDPVREGGQSNLAALIDHFKLGYANRTLGYRLPSRDSQKGKDMRAALQRIGLLRETGHEHFSGSLVVPILAPDGSGNAAQVYGRKITRNLRKGTPNHLYLPGPMKGVFNIEAFAASDEMILCEALIDAMTFWVAGYRNVTAAFGTNGLTDVLLTAFKTHGVKRVLVAYDRDAAGDKASTDAAEKLTAVGIEAFRILFPKGMDANAYACAVKPASQSLGALIRSAEWIGSGPVGEGRQIKTAPKRCAQPAASAPAAASEKAAKRKETEERAASASRSETALQAETPKERAEPSSQNNASLLAAKLGVAASDESETEAPASLPVQHASPIPPGPPEIDAEVREHEVCFTFADRHWRVRGLAKNMSYETLRVNVLARRDVSGMEAFHVDAFDLYNAKHRASFIAQAAGELGLSKDAIKGDLARVLLKLEALQEEQITAALEGERAAPSMTADDERAALEFLKSPDLMERIAADAEACGIVGERANVLALYLASISRKLDKPLAVLIQSTSAAGKSALMDAVLEFVPDEERVQYAAMTGQALFYLGETAVKHKVLAIAEEEGAREASYALKLLQSQGDLSIASTGKDPITGKLITQDYRVEGPVALAMTTTAIDLDEELKNRCLVLTVNESRDQTAAIHARQRFEETLDGLLASENSAAIVARHQNAQRMLKPLRVVNPYAEQLTFLSDKTRSRRDHRKYLGLIRAIVLLRQHQRPVCETVTADGEIVEYVEATLDDIAAANALAHEVLGKTLDELPPQTRALLTVIHEMVTKACGTADMRQSDYRFTRRDVREASGWSHTQLRVHLSRLQEFEYVIAHRGARGQRFTYELAYEGSGADGDPFMMGLIDVERLRNIDGNPAYDAKLAGVNDELAGSKRPHNGGMAGTSRGGDFANRQTETTSCANASENAPGSASKSENRPASYTNGVVATV